MQKSVHSLVQGSIYCSLAMPLLYHTSNGYTIRYDTIEEINVDYTVDYPPYHVL